MNEAVHASGAVHDALLALGSNLGNSEATLRGAVDGLRNAGLEIVDVSAFVVTSPVGGPPQPDFLNGAVHVRTRLEPLPLLRLLKRLEAEAGRDFDEEHWGPRTLDLDLLLFDDWELATPELCVPHPRLHERAFVLTPASEIAPDWVHPRLGRTVRELLEAL